MWHFPQFSGMRAVAELNECRPWHAAQEPLLPSGFTRPMPLFGHVVPLSCVFHDAAVALAAAVVGRGPAFDDFADHVVERPDEFRGVGVMALLKFAHLLRVASSAIVRGDDDGDLVAVVVKRRRIMFACLMARIAVHARFGMRTGFPLFDDPRRRIRMAFQASLTF